MRNITFMGTGYVGLVSGACLASLGHHVHGFDIDAVKINNLKNGIIPIYEDGLENVIKENIAQKRIGFGHDIKQALDNCDAVFIAVGTPQGDDGRADMTYYQSAIKMIGEYSVGDLVIINKSTVEVGTAQWAHDYLTKHHPNKKFYMVSNPEFLREGSAIGDFMNSDRVVLGFDKASNGEYAHNIMRDIYVPLCAPKNIPIVETDWQTAELIKYSANSFLAVKIAFINQMADLCAKANADGQLLAHAIGLDKRIGEKFLQIGPGYGGSCFPKDTNAIVNIAKDNFDHELTIIQSAIDANKNRKENLANYVIEITQQQKPDNDIYRVAILGLSFKANTDDVRESSAIAMIEILHQHGFTITAHDPIAIANMQQEIGIVHHINWCDDIIETITNKDAVVIMTEWQDYINLTADDFKKAAPNAIIFDFRNIYDKRIMLNANINYHYLG